MKSRKKIAIVLLLSMICTIFCGYEVTFDEDKTRVLDAVGYFSEEEKEGLQNYLTEKSIATELDLVVYIENMDVGGDYQEELLVENVYDESGFGYDSGHSGVVLYINTNTRYVHICTTGIAIWYLDDYDIQDIIDDIFDELQEGDYYKATKYFADDVEAIVSKFMGNDEEGIEVWKENDYTMYEDFYSDWVSNNRDVDYGLGSTPGEYVKMILKSPVGCLTIGAIISGIIVLILCMKQKSKMKANGNTYMDKSQYVTNTIVDQYLRTTTVKTKIETSSGGGGGGGSFSGGHGGGGRHF